MSKITSLFMKQSGPAPLEQTQSTVRVATDATHLERVHLESQSSDNGVVVGVDVQESERSLGEEPTLRI